MCYISTQSFFLQYTHIEKRGLKRYLYLASISGERASIKTLGLVEASAPPASKRQNGANIAWSMQFYILRAMSLAV